jgi:CRP/FNR family transcriptional regulator
MIKVKLLENFKFISQLEPKTLTEVARRAYELDIPDGQTLFIEGMAAEACYFILKGQLRVSRMNKEGRMQVLARLGPDAPVNIISLLKEDNRNHASVDSLTPVKLVVLGANDFNYLIENHPDFSKVLLKIFAERMAKITDLASDLSLYTVRARLAQFLIELADQPQAAGGWTQDEIAAHIGTVRDVVGRLLRDFESKGLISRERQQIFLLDRQGLRKEAEKYE